MKFQKLISKMTLEEKCSLLSGATQFTTEGIPKLGIDSVFLADGPHGIRKQSGSSDHLGLNPSIPATCYPVAAAVANSWNEMLAEQIGEHLGSEARMQGVQILLGPGLNIKRNPLCGRNFEYFSEDPYLSGKLAASYVRGIQHKGVAACPKHFAVNSQESFRMANDSILDERTLREIYLSGFEIAVKEGKPKAMMSSYNKVNGEYANDSKKLLEDILVKEWRFDGIVVTDWGGSNDRVTGLLAGNHLEMPATKGNSDREVIKAVKEGRVSEEVLNKRIDELLSVIVPLNELNGAEKTCDMKEHHLFAKKAAEESIVLLKNEAGILPLKQGTKVAVIGDFAALPRYQGSGSSQVNSTFLDIPLDEIKKSELEFVGYSAGFDRYGMHNDEKVNEALTLAENAETVLCYLGLDETAESEGLDREHIRLHDNQVELLQAISNVNPNIIVILSAGSVIEMPWIRQAKAILHGSLGGQACAGAMVDILLGKVNPSGKLAETYPICYEDVPSANYYLKHDKSSEYREGIYVGYRYYDKASREVQFPFGYGLSYTSFEYSNLEADDTGVNVTIKNTGEMSGSEVVQMYISYYNPNLFTPDKELKGFCKVFLEPGEEKVVQILFDTYTFRFFDTTKNRFAQAEGMFKVSIGASVSDIRLKTDIYHEGEKEAFKNRINQSLCYKNGDVTRVSDIEFEELLGRKIPANEWNQGEPIDRNQPIASLKYAKSHLARCIYRVLTRKKEKAHAKGKPDLNILFIYNMPFRGIAKMTGGMVDMHMVDAMLEIVNGRFFKGLSQLFQSYIKMRKEQKGDTK